MAPGVTLPASLATREEILACHARVRESDKYVSRLRFLIPLVVQVRRETQVHTSQTRGMAGNREAIGEDTRSVYYELNIL